MDAMKEALKAKRTGSGLLMGEESEGSPMQALVAKLSPEDKEELLSLLQSDQGEESADKVERGAPTSDEKAKIAAKVEADGAEDEMQDDESDDIQASLVGTRFKNAGDDVEPRNLGERAQLYGAKRLKAKGKM